MSTVTLASLFDGIGGFPLSGIRCGITPVWASEIEDFPIAVTKQRIPEMAHLGDITKLKGNELPAVDIVCGGSPCQDLSVAGKRAGLQGERSGLFMEQIRVIKEMRAYDARTKRTNDTVRPRYMVWENVPGVFSSESGNDFQAVLEETCRIADSSVSVPRPQGGVWLYAGTILGQEFSLAWRVLDAQYWGLAQRRKRIFLVADFGGHTAPKILFEQESLFGNSAQSEEAGQGAAAGTPKSVGTSSGHSSFNGCANNECLTPWDTQQKRISTEQSIAPTLEGAKGAGENPAGLLLAAGVVSKGNGDCFLTPEQHTSLTSGGGQAGQGYPCVLTAGFSAETASAASGIGCREECASTLKASESGTKMVPDVLCLNDQGGNRIDVTENITATLRAQMDGHQPLVLGDEPGSPEDNQQELYENHGIDSRYTGPHQVAPPISARCGTGGNNLPLVSQSFESYCIAGNIIDRQDHNGGNGMGFQKNISYTLNTADRHCVFSHLRSDEYAPNNVVSTQNAHQCKDATDILCESEIAGIDCRSGKENGDMCGTLQAHPSGGYSLNSIHPVRIKKMIRRLTPLECERLMGFPDGWTDIPKASDSVRYKALGNSVAIPCVEFILRGIACFLRK